MDNRTEIQIASVTKDTPSASDIDDWIRSALDMARRSEIELTVRIVDETEIVSLNRQYRNQDKATDVLAFPADIDLPGISPKPLGDVVVCADVVNRQAHELNRSPRAHWARIVAHGVLHLCGYDHQTLEDSMQMEQMEDSVLQRHGLNGANATNQT